MKSMVLVIAVSLLAGCASYVPLPDISEEHLVSHDKQEQSKTALWISLVAAGIVLASLEQDSGPEVIQPIENDQRIWK